MSYYLHSISFQPYFFIYFFFLVTGHPLNSTLFPYTTLFRSGGLRAGRRGPHGHGLLGDLLRAGHRAGGGAAADRKSTRLNSSHRCISYAVFCLKKKIKVEPDIQETLLNRLEQQNRAEYLFTS